MTDEEFQVVQCMSQYGGGFVQSLAECFRRADRVNFAKLQIAFSNYWEQYKEMSEKITNNSL